MKAYIAVPTTLALVARAYSRQSLTPIGILTAALTATVHALHPSPLPFTLLVVFFLLGTTATKVKHEIKAHLTLSSSGSSGGEGPRTSIQVLANSGVASALILTHIFKYGLDNISGNEDACFGNLHARDLLLVGIISNYAAVTADTLSSELGILSRSLPRLITSLREVPRGTNGGVTPAGLVAGMGGGAIIGVVSSVLLPFCAPETLPQMDNIEWMKRRFGFIDMRVEWSAKDKIFFILAVTLWGTLGSILDSLLGAVLQASVVDRRTGKIVEGSGGVKVMTTAAQTEAAVQRRKFDGNKVEEEYGPSRSISTGRDILDNNQINLLMALLMSLGGIVSASLFWNLSLTSIFS